ncbi:hypothetical protein L208DRAFT_1294730 [Tricholoma matsutake]|nr:hypothetical protein L208DRAFT_1294730 [Tricholoma matsutake 945]
MKLRNYELVKEEWKVAEELCEVLKIFKDATLFFSRELSAKHPAMNTATVIPAMDTIDEELAMNALSSRYSVAVHAALSVSKKTLNRYYAKTDLSKTYRIVMVLHPCHKLNYFKTARWEDNWIEAARQLV